MYNSFLIIIKIVTYCFCVKTDIYNEICEYNIKRYVIYWNKKKILRVRFSGELFLIDETMIYTNICIYCECVSV